MEPQKPETNSTYNLLREPWIPVRRHNGQQEWIAPYQLTDGIDGNNPIVALDSVRPDFNGALIQFLIGLVQTTMPPKNESEWKQSFLHPPTSQQLQETFAKVEHAFHLDGEGPRFMQELDPFDKASQHPIYRLLYDYPGGKTVDDNTDHFTKAPNKDAFHLGTSALACTLLTHQINANSGGKGIRTSLRGGGPLCTLLTDSTLWKTIMWNVLSGKEWQWTKQDVTEGKANARIFPWLASTQTSENGETILMNQVHPSYMYWAMPRRVRLEFPSPEETSDALCSLHQRTENSLLKHFQTKPYGNNYGGVWQHPCTPQNPPSKAGEEPTTLKGSPRAIRYTNWPDYRSPEPTNQRYPAPTIRYFRSRYRHVKQMTQQKRLPKLWCFGFDFDNAKLKAWYEAYMPLFFLPEEQEGKFYKETQRLVDTASYVFSVLRSQLKHALFDHVDPTSTPKKTKWFKSKTKVDTSLFTSTETYFWQRTTSPFYAKVQCLIEPLNSEQMDTLKREWLQTIRQTATNLFREALQLHQMQINDPKAAALAYSAFLKMTAPQSKKIMDHLQLKTQPK